MPGLARVWNQPPMLPSTIFANFNFLFLVSWVVVSWVVVSWVVVSCVAVTGA